MKKIVILIVVLIAVSAAGVWYYAADYSKQQEGKSQDAPIVDTAKTMNIKNFSLGGTVNSVNGDEVYFRTGIVRNTTEGNKFIDEDKIAKISGATVIMKASGGKASVKNLKQGTNVSIDSLENPFDLKEFNASKITINP